MFGEILQPLVPWIPHFIVFLFGIRYLFRPWFGFIQNRIDAQTTVEIIDGAHYPLPDAFRKRVDRVRDELDSLGFVPHLEYCYSITQNSETIRFVFVNPQSRRSASVIGVLGATRFGQRLVQVFTVISSVYLLPGRPILQTTNENEGGVAVLPLMPSDINCRFPHVSEVRRLLMLHERLEARHFPDAHTDLPTLRMTPDESCEFAEARIRTLMEHWLAIGCIQRIPGSTAYRLPLWTIYKMCWGGSLYLGPILKCFRCRRSRQLEQDLLKTPD